MRGPQEPGDALGGDGPLEPGALDGGADDQLTRRARRGIDVLAVHAVRENGGHVSEGDHLAAPGLDGHRRPRGAISSVQAPAARTTASPSTRSPSVTTPARPPPSTTTR